MAQETVIRDRTGKRLGIIVEEGSRLVARGVANLPLGYYPPKNDHTKETNQQIICRGSTLPALILRASGL